MGSRAGTIGQPSGGRWSALVFERFDPTEKSLDWLRERGGELTLGYALWEQPFWRYSDEEFIAAARGKVAVMGASGVRITRRIIEALPELRCISKFGIGVDCAVLLGICAVLIVVAARMYPRLTT